MAALVNEATPVQGSGDGTLSSVIDLSVTAGNLIVVMFETRDTASSSVTSVTGSLSGAFTKAVGTIGGYIWYATAASTGTEDVEIVWSAGGGNTTYYIQMAQFSGLATSSVLDQTAAGNNSAPSGPPYNYVHASITPTGAGLVIGVGSIATNANKTAGASYTKFTFTDAFRQMAQYSTSIGTSTTDAPFTADASGTYYYAIANFLDASGGSSIVAHAANANRRRAA